MDAVNVFLPSRWNIDDSDAECNRRSTFTMHECLEEFQLLDPVDPFGFSSDRHFQPACPGFLPVSAYHEKRSVSGHLAATQGSEAHQPHKASFTQACHRRVRSASVFLPSSAQGLPGLVPQLLKEEPQPATMSEDERVPPQRWNEGAPDAKRRCRWERECEVPATADPMGIEATPCNDGLMSRMSSCTAAIDTEMVSPPAVEDSPSSHQRRFWPSVFSGRTSPFAMPKVFSLDETSLAMLNQRLQASSDQLCSHPKTPPKQMQPPRPMVLSPPMLLSADALQESTLPGIKITRICSSQTPRSGNADASPCVSPEQK